MYYKDLMFKQQVDENTCGIGNKKLVLDSISITKIPISLIEEQHRIVEKLDLLLPLCEQLEQMTVE